MAPHLQDRVDTNDLPRSYVDPRLHEGFKTLAPDFEAVGADYQIWKLEQPRFVAGGCARRVGVLVNQLDGRGGNHRAFFVADTAQNGAECGLGEGRETCQREHKQSKEPVHETSKNMSMIVQQASDACNRPDASL